MNAIKKVIAIKNTISELGGEFISLVNENSVLVGSNKNATIWEIPYTESNEGFIFDGTKAEKVKQNKRPIDPVIVHTNRLRKGINNLFTDNNYDESIGVLKATIRTLPYVEEEDKIACQEVMADGKTKCTGTVVAGVCSNPNCPGRSNNKPVIEKNEVNAVTTGAEKMEEMFTDYSKATFLFGESGEINANGAITPFTIAAKSNLIAETDNFLRKVSQYKNIKKQISEQLEAGVSNKIFNSLDWSENFDVALAKALTVAKVSDPSLNILTTRKMFKDTVSIFYGEEVDMSKAAPWVYNLTTPNPTDDKTKIPFLKFRTGAFTYESLKVISEELGKAFASKDLVAEELDKLANYRMIVEYMIQSKQINDHVLTAMVEDFNKTFVKSDSEYQDSPLGWRSRDEQLQGWVKGFARAIDINLAKVEA